LDRVDIRLIKEYITGCHLVSAVSAIEILSLVLFYIFSEWGILRAVVIALLFTIILIEFSTIMMLWKIGIQIIGNKMEKVAILCLQADTLRFMVFTILLSTVALNLLMKQLEKHL